MKKSIKQSLLCSIIFCWSFSVMHSAQVIFNSPSSDTVIDSHDSDIPEYLGSSSSIETNLLSNSKVNKTQNKKTQEIELLPEQKIKKLEKDLVALNFERSKLDDEKSKLDLKINENLTRSIMNVNEAIKMIDKIKTKDDENFYVKKRYKLLKIQHMVSTRKMHLMTKIKFLHNARRWIEHYKYIERMWLSLAEIIGQQFDPKQPQNRIDEVREGITLAKTIQEMTKQIRENLEKAHALDTDEYGIYPAMIHEYSKFINKYIRYID